MHVVSYDISIDRIRKKIADTLSNYGKRVQYSVFECTLSAVQYQELYQKLADLVAEDEEGSVRFYFLCERCSSKVTVMGMKEEEPENEDVLVI